VLPETVEIFWKQVFAVRWRRSKETMNQTLILLMCWLFTVNALLTGINRCSNRVRSKLYVGRGFGKDFKAVASTSQPLKSKGMTSGKKTEKAPFNPVASDSIKPYYVSQLALSRYLPSVELHYPGLKAISLDPPVIEIDNFFSTKECDEYITFAQNLGTQIASQTFSPMTSTARTSTTWYLYYKHALGLIERANKLLGIPIHHFEEPQVVRYKLGEQFSWHLDAIPSQLVPKSGQRAATLLVYLNSVLAGGATCFKELNLKVQPVKGKALLFFPTFNDGQSDDRTLHSGQVAIDTKWIAQMWIHDRPYIPSVPADNSHSDALALLSKQQQR
jgi:hypothetical protein